MSANVQEKKKFKVPHTYVVLFWAVFVIAVLTWLIPPGQFDYEQVEVNGSMRNLAISGSYHTLEDRNPATVLSFFNSFHKGMMNGGSLIALIFMVSGCFYIIVRTGAFHALLGSLLRAFGNKSFLLIPVSFFFFALGGTLFGMLNEFNGFYPIFVGLGIALGYDALFGMSIMTLGMYIGFAASLMNPFTVVIAQVIAGVPVYSGTGFRVICLIVFSAISIWWIFRYGNKIKKDPSKSLMADQPPSKFAFDRDHLEQYAMTGRIKLILMTVLVCLVYLMYGFIKLDFGQTQLTAVFLFMSIIAALIDRWSPDRYANELMDGCRNVVYGALVVGVAQAILVIMTEANIIDTVINFLGTSLQNVPSYMAAQGMLVVQTLLNFVIPSGSGQAATIMPIMAPLGDMLGVSRQVSVLAYQFGDGFSNLLWPTCGCVVACGLSGIPLEKWWKFFIPLFGWLFLAQVILLAVAQIVGL